MAKQKTLEQLRDEKERAETQLAQYQHKEQKLKNRIAYYEKGDRRKRAHHLITRGAAIEEPITYTRIHSFCLSSFSALLGQRSRFELSQ